MILSTELALTRAQFVPEATDPVPPGPLPHAEEPGAGVGAGEGDVLAQRGEHFPLLRRAEVGLVMVVLVERLAGTGLDDKSEGEK